MAQAAPQEDEIGSLLDKAEVAPAEVAGALMQYHDEPDKALDAVRIVVETHSKHKNGDVSLGDDSRHDNVSDTV